MDKVIFVDDESAILEGLRRGLRRKRGTWEMHFFERAEEALDYIRKFGVDVVVSDMRMPKMNGAEFLQSVQQIRPDAVRLALSGYADSQLILESAHAIHQFISKPTSINTITQTIERSVKLQAALNDPELQNYVGGLKALPTMPHVYDEISQLFTKETYSQRELVEIIEKDMGFTATVLRIVNSDFFGNFGNITSISDAVNMLGPETLHNILLSENVFAQFENVDTDELEHLNYISKLISALAHKFARSAALSERATDHAQLAGMVCTMGDMLKLDAGTPNGTVSSPTLTAYLLKLWSMPDTLIEAVLIHRDPVCSSFAARLHDVSAADCVRAAWFAYDDYLTIDERARHGMEVPLRKTLEALAKRKELANAWYDHVSATVLADY
ncbi:MAG: HDOD domain-containing protein [Pseudomonadota bacterium]